MQKKKKKNEISTLSHTITKIRSKWIKNLRARTKNSLAINIDINLCYCRVGNSFLVIIAKSTSNKDKIDMWNFIKIKNF